MFQKGFIPPDQLLMRKLVKLIEQEFKHNKTPRYYAEKLNFSERRINRMLKREKNITLHELIQLRIHREAVELIIETHMSVKEISYELGVLDPCYFSRCFKKISGIQPLKFRRINAVNDEK
jgi:AraC-like DNA-binding protein